MSGTGTLQDATAETTRPLVWALLISISVHVFLYAGFELGQKVGWWQKDFMPAWLKKSSPTLAMIQKAQQAQPPRTEQDVPLMFVDVDPAVATPAPPKNAKYYSSRNSVAANPDAQIETDTPKIDGTQTHIIKTETVDRTKATPLQPAVPKQPTPEQQEAQARPKGGQKIGDLAMAKASPDMDKLMDKPGDGQADGQNGQAAEETHARPRTLVEAYSQHPELIPGEKMKQEGGVHLRLTASSLDTKATPFGEYDEELIRAIQAAWYQLLDGQRTSTPVSGKVVIYFRLKYDGQVQQVSVLQNDVQNYVYVVLCQEAIQETAPYAAWPSDMRRVFSSGYRDVQFTFYYDY